MKVLAEIDGVIQWVDLSDDTFRGKEGPGGKSAYELAQLNGFTGTVAEWLKSLKGDKGEPGKDWVPEPPKPYVPVYQKVLNGQEYVDHTGQWFKVQSPDKDHSYGVDFNNPKHTFTRTEIRKGDTLLMDKNNLSGGIPRERVEDYMRELNVPFGEPIWYRVFVFIEHGKPINFTVKDWFQFIMQWHATDQEVKVKTPPNIGVRLQGDATLVLSTSGDPSMTPKNVPQTERARIDVKRGEWFNMAFRMVFDTVKGSLVWYIDGETVYEGWDIPMAFANKFAGYPKKGAYRSSHAEDFAAQFADPILARGDEFNYLKDEKLNLY